MKKNVYPSKTTLNLAMREKSPFRFSKLAPMLAVLLILAGVFGKFAVQDRLSRLDRAREEAAALRQRKAELEQTLETFPAVKAEYDRYATGWMTEEERALVPRERMLCLIEGELMTGGQVLRFAAAGNTLSVELGETTLEQTGQLVQRLYEVPGVTNVSVYTASNKPKQGESGTVSMVITMEQGEKGADEE